MPPGGGGCTLGKDVVPPATHRRTARNAWFCSAAGCPERHGAARHPPPYCAKRVVLQRSGVPRLLGCSGGLSSVMPISFSARFDARPDKHDLWTGRRASLATPYHPGSRHSWLGGTVPRNLVAHAAVARTCQVGSWQQLWGNRQSTGRAPAPATTGLAPAPQDNHKTIARQSTRQFKTRRKMDIWWSALKKKI